MVNKPKIRFSKRTFPLSVDEFLTYLKTIKGKADSTINAYKKDLCIFFRFMLLWKGEVDEDIEFNQIDIRSIDIKFISEITLQDIHKFLYYVQEQRENVANTRARKVATLRSYFNYLCNIDKSIENNPTLNLETPQKKKHQPIYLNIDESIQLLKSLDSNKKNYLRDYCILTLFLNCGMRLSELCGIQISRIKGDTLVILGKGDKERTIYLNPPCLKAIDDYVKSRDISKIPVQYKDYLFLSTHNRPINPRTVEKMVKNKISNAKISNPEKYSPHKLRHTAATHLYRNHVDILKIKAILGHSSISTTEIYMHLDDDSIRAAVNVSPIATEEYLIE